MNGQHTYTYYITYYILYIGTDDVKCASNQYYYIVGQKWISIGQ